MTTALPGAGGGKGHLRRKDVTTSPLRSPLAALRFVEEGAEPAVVFSDFVLFVELNKRKQRFYFAVFIAFCAVSALLLLIISQKRHATETIVLSCAAHETRRFHVSGWRYSTMEASGTRGDAAQLFFSHV